MTAPLPTSLKGLHRIIEHQATKLREQKKTLKYQTQALQKDYVAMTPWQGFKFFLNCIRYKKKYER